MSTEHHAPPHPDAPGPGSPAPAAPAPAAPPDPAAASSAAPADVALRPARPSDVDAVLAFWREAAEGTSVSDDPAGVARLLERDPGALILAESGGALVGSLIAGWDGWRCHLYRLAVHPRHRRRGIARLLLAAAEERFAALGGRRLDAMVLDANALAHRAWDAAGYAPEPQ